MISIRLPVWLRVVLVAAVVLLAIVAGLFGYRWYVQPVTLTIAVGSLDGEAGKIVSAIASRLALMSAPVRLSVVEKSSALEAANAFSSGKVDLAVVRSDVGDVSQMQAVVVMAHAVVLILAPPGSELTDIASLRHRTVGVVGGAINQSVVEALREEYGLDRAGVTFKSLAPRDARRALATKEVDALLLVIPLIEKYLTQVRSLFVQNAKAAPVLIAIESAGAIAETHRAYESFDVPKGTLRGAPPVPQDDLTTLRVSFYLVAQKKLDPDTVADLTRSLLAARRDLIGELPILAQVSAPDTDPSAFLSVHPGAAEYYNGTQESFMDKWSNAIYLTPMVLGGLASVLAFAWKFLGIRELQAGEATLDSLYALSPRIRKATSEAELSDIENVIDRILSGQRTKDAPGDDGAAEVATLNVAAHRLQTLIHDRRRVLERPGPESARPQE